MGEGGTYLVVLPGQKAPKDAGGGYRVVESPTNNILPGFRVPATDAKQADVQKSGYQVYSQAKRDNPRKTQIVPAEGKKWSDRPATGHEYWQLATKMLNEKQSTSATEDDCQIS